MLLSLKAVFGASLLTSQVGSPRLPVSLAALLCLCLSSLPSSASRSLFKAVRAQAQLYSQLLSRCLIVFLRSVVSVGSVQQVLGCPFGIAVFVGDGAWGLCWLGDFAGRAQVQRSWSAGLLVLGQLTVFSSKDSSDRALHSQTA